MVDNHRTMVVNTMALHAGRLVFVHVGFLDMNFCLNAFCTVRLHGVLVSDEQRIFVMSVTDAQNARGPSTTILLRIGWLHCA